MFRQTTVLGKWLAVIFFETILAIMYGYSQESHMGLLLLGSYRAGLADLNKRGVN